MCYIQAIQLFYSCTRMAHYALCKQFMHVRRRLYRLLQGASFSSFSRIDLEHQTIQKYYNNHACMHARMVYTGGKL